MPNVIYWKFANPVAAKPETRFSDEELRSWQFNIFKTMRENPDANVNSDAEAARRKIHAEFEIRYAILPNEKTNGRLPDGNMKLYKYDVGKTSNLTKEERDEKLDFIYSVELLPIWSKSYMRLWGRPRTIRRLEAMRRFIQSQIISHEDCRGYADAVRDWNESLDYLGEIWKHAQRRAR